MVKPFKLSWPSGRSDAMDKEDIENTKRALDALGLYEPPQFFTERFSTEPMIRGLKKFQRQEGLEPDGVMNPNGPTHRRMNEVLVRSLEKETRRVNDIPNARSNKSPQSFITGKERPPKGPSIQPFAKDREPKFADMTNSSKNFDEERESKDTQTAAVPVAAPFALWLMEFVGAASIVAAMAIYNSWSKRRQKTIRDTYKTQNHGEDNFCQQRYDDEFDRCLTLDQK